MRDIFYLFVISVTLFSLYSPEALGVWEGRRDVAAQMEWDKLYLCKECAHD